MHMTQILHIFISLDCILRRKYQISKCEGDFPTILHYKMLMTK